MARSHQLCLFGIEPRALPREEREDAPPLAETEDPFPGQIDLFADRACVSRDLEAALRDGDFPEASRLRRMLEETYGGSAETRTLSFLEDRTGPLTSADPEESLSVWRALDSGLADQPRLRRLVREGVFRRLLDRHSAEDLEARDPGALPALTLTLVLSAEGSGEEERRKARALVRNALLAGHRQDPLDFRWDEPLADLLAEDEPPIWLACLGAIRRLWPTPRLTSEELTMLSAPFENPVSPEEAAIAFWS